MDSAPANIVIHRIMNLRIFMALYVPENSFY